MIALFHSDHRSHPAHPPGTQKTALSVNVNKVALLRKPRNPDMPSRLPAARVCRQGGAPGTTVPPRAGAARTSGQVRAYVGYDARMAWGSIPETEGKYTINDPIPRSWLFGPYVVEVGVDWNATVTQDGVPTPSDVVQTARFYDAFLVTPPSALSPPSPVYNAQLTTWYDDWR